MLLSPVASKMKLKSFSWDKALCDLALPLLSCISSYSPSLNLVPSNCVCNAVVRFHGEHFPFCLGYPEVIFQSFLSNSHMPGYV